MDIVIPMVFGVVVYIFLITLEPIQNKEKRKREKKKNEDQELCTAVNLEVTG